jgi:hypothetical protein
MDRRGSGVPATVISEIVSRFFAISMVCEAENFASTSLRIAIANCGRHGGTYYLRAWSPGYQNGQRAMKRTVSSI